MKKYSDLVRFTQIYSDVVRWAEASVARVTLFSERDEGAPDGLIGGLSIITSATV